MRTKIFSRVFVLLALVGCDAAPVLQPARITGQIVSEGPCAVGLAGQGLLVVSPSLQHPQRTVTTVITGDGGVFSFDVPDSGFDLVAGAPGTTIIWTGLSPALGYARLEVPIAGAQPIVAASFPARFETSSPSCMNARRFAQSRPAPGQPDVRIETDDAGVLTASALRCADDLENPWGVDFFDTDVGGCAARMTSWMTSGTQNTLAYPPPATISELVVEGSSGVHAPQQALAPDGGDLVVKVVNRFGEQTLAVDGAGWFSPPGDALIEVSSASATAFVTHTSSSGEALVELPGFPQGISPVSGATDFGVGTRFEWTRTIDAPQMLVIAPPAGNNIRLVVFTDQTHFVMPELASLGLPLLPAARYEWSVFSTTLVPALTVEQLIRAPAWSRSLAVTDTLLGEVELFTP